MFRYNYTNLGDLLKHGDMKYKVNDKVTLNLQGNAFYAVITEVDVDRKQYCTETSEGYKIWCYEHEISPIINNEIAQKCRHKYVLYIGLTDQFNHCEKCGHKEKEPEHV